MKIHISKTTEYNIYTLVIIGLMSFIVTVATMTVF